MTLPRVIGVRARLEEVSTSEYIRQLIEDAFAYQVAVLPYKTDFLLDIPDNVSYTVL